MKLTNHGWNRLSRHCVRCGHVGPRVRFNLGWWHEYCLPEEVRQQRNRIARFIAAAAAQFREIAKQENL